MKYVKGRFANIMCDKEHKPYLLMVADDNESFEVKITNTSLRTVKKAATDVYGVNPSNILVYAAKERE